MGALSVNSDNFDCEVLKCSKPVIVDFWASWCGPCMRLSPIIDEIADELSDKVKIVKVNTEENPSINTQYNVLSIPTLILFKNGKMIDSMIGVSSKKNISDWILSII
ncbi:thioredoxin [Candidatus Liberibacter americanus]|uniref:Thioredoxin n=1 Tax=Candidatus Liberibacter americanus str. Sao Paulo TaxID=1261131 RepID=U6B4F0_9HYPH|nr:thioredoxin [Candidatus Liberibacter americanus]AHA27508.1 Thiol-disulfide isomerase and thioredoxin [Candidatus Liberibacter americanus str. Sao Paulo]EMS36530.1 thioredoxin [Candidatus Liberibacter americanus PW_SP]